MRFSVLMVLTLCGFHGVQAATNTMPRHPRDVIPRATSDNDKPTLKPSSPPKPTDNDPPSSSKDPSKPPKPTDTPSPTHKPDPKPTESPSPTHKPDPKPTSSPKPPVSPPPTNTPAPTDDQQTGLTQGAKIGIGIGIPLAVLAIGGVIAAYVIGNRRGRKRRVDDPSAGAGQRIRDPSDELNLVRTPTGVVELSAAGNGAYHAQTYERTESGSGRASWWKPASKSGGSAQKYGHVAQRSPSTPLSPQELPA